MRRINNRVVVTSTAIAVTAQSAASSSTTAPPLPDSPYNRDALEKFEGYTPEGGYCGRIATVARQPPADGDDANASPSGGSNSSGHATDRYTAEQGTLLARVCALGNALEQDLKRIRYELFDKQQMRYTNSSTAKAAGRDVGGATAASFSSSSSGSSSSSSTTGSSTSSNDAKVIRNGSSAYIMQPIIATVRAIRKARQGGGGASSSADANTSLALHADAADKNVFYFNQRQLNYYSRMNMTPKRHLVWGVYTSAWNLISATTMAGCAMVAIPLHYAMMGPFPTRDMVLPSANGGSPIAAAAHKLATHPSKAVRLPYGIYRGMRAVALYSFLGLVVSPIIHISQALCNTPFGIRNAIHPRYTFDAADGVWIEHSVPDAVGLRRDMIDRMQQMMAVGKREAFARKVAGEAKWKDHLHKLGISRAGKGNSQSDDPYDILNVPRDATQQQIKASYQKLAKMYHPDVNASSGLSDKEKEEMRDRFDTVAGAYKILSNAEQRRLYDRGGKKAVEMQQGAVLVGSSGDVMERVFGGIYFRETLCGMHFRSHWHMKFQFQCCVSIGELEELQSMQMRLVAANLATILDTHAKDAMITPFIHLGSNPKATAASAMASAASSAFASADKGSSKPNPLERKVNNTTGSSAKSSLGGNPSKGGKTNISSAAPKKQQGDAKAGNTTASAEATSAAPKKADTAPKDPLVWAMTTPPTDGEFSYAFRQRTQKFITKLATACFGRELLHELGTCYETSAKAYLGVDGVSFYAPKKLQFTKNWSGIRRVYDQFKVRVSEKSKEEMQQLAAIEFFSMEWDNVVCDVHVQARFVSQLVVWSNDGEAPVSAATLANVLGTSEPTPKTPTGISADSLRYKRLRALWYLGLQMKKEGMVFDESGRATDKDLIEYFKRASKAGMDTPPVF